MLLFNKKLVNLSDKNAIDTLVNEGGEESSLFEIERVLVKVSIPFV